MYLGIRPKNIVGKFKIDELLKAFKINRARKSFLLSSLISSNLVLNNFNKVPSSSMHRVDEKSYYCLSSISMI